MLSICYFVRYPLLTGKAHLLACTVESLVSLHLISSQTHAEAMSSKVLMALRY